MLPLCVSPCLDAMQAGDLPRNRSFLETHLFNLPTSTMSRSTPSWMYMMVVALMAAAVLLPGAAAKSTQQVTPACMHAEAAAGTHTAMQLRACAAQCDVRCNRTGLWAAIRHCLCTVACAHAD